MILQLRLRLPTTRNGFITKPYMKTFPGLWMSNLQTIFQDRAFSSLCLHNTAMASASPVQTG